MIILFSIKLEKNFMKGIFLLFALIIQGRNINAQPIRIAIFDFDNISGVDKYDGLGKAMSSMLISDIESNVSPKRLQLVERAQIQKILKEQKFQASGSVNKSSAVQAGKLFGVNYLLIGDVFVLNDQLILNARLTNTETGDIVFSKKQEGKTDSWLLLKTKIAKDITFALSQPFLDPFISDKVTPIATITTFGNAISSIDRNEFDKAESIITTLQDFTPDFKYIDDLNVQINNLKKKLDKVEKDIEITTTDPIVAAKNYDKSGNFNDAEKYFLIGLSRLNKNQLGAYIKYNLLLAELCFKYNLFTKTISYCDSILEIYPYFDNAILYKSQSILQLGNKKIFNDWSKKLLLKSDEISISSYFDDYLKKYMEKFKIQRLVDISSINSRIFGFDILLEDIRLYQGSIEIFSFLLNNYCDLNTELNDITSTLNFLKNGINTINTITNNKLKIQQDFAFYMPNSEFTSKVAELKDNLIILKNGVKYIGPYFDTYDGELWSKSSPRECPCLRIVKANDFLAMKNVKLREEWQVVSFQLEGWYSLLNKDYKNARQKIVDVIYYQFSHLEKINTNNRFVDILKNNERANSILLNYQDAEFDRILFEFRELQPQLSDAIVNNLLNYGHSFLLENNLNLAKKIYTLFDPSRKLETFQLSIKEIIFKDFNEFVTRGLITKNKLDDLMKNIY